MRTGRPQRLRRPGSSTGGNDATPTSIQLGPVQCPTLCHASGRAVYSRMADARGVYDLTRPVHERMAVFPGDAPPRVRRLSTIEEGAPLTASMLEMSCHVGTHVDAPAHFLANGRKLSDFVAGDFCGPAVVLDLERHANVTADALREREIPEGRHLLLRTRNSARPDPARYDPDHAFIEDEAAEYLLGLRPLSIGFDDYSVDSGRDDALPVHRRFAEAGRLVYVCLDLSVVPTGPCAFFGLPLRLDDVEAAPVRALALTGESARILAPR
jgi:arylformamidase